MIEWNVLLLHWKENTCCFLLIILNLPPATDIFAAKHCWTFPEQIRKWENRYNIFMNFSVNVIIYSILYTRENNEENKVAQLKQMFKLFYRRERVLQVCLNCLLNIINYDTWTLQLCELFLDNLCFQLFSFILWKIVWQMLIIRVDL